MQFPQDFKTLRLTPVATLIQQMGFRPRYVVHRDGDIVEQQLVSATESESDRMFINLEDALQEAYRIFVSDHLERYHANQALVNNTSWFQKWKLSRWSGEETAKKYQDFIQKVSDTKSLSEVRYDVFVQDHLTLRTLPEHVQTPAFLPLHTPIFVLNADGFVGSWCGKVRETAIHRIYLRKTEAPTTGEEVFSFSYSCDNLGEFNPYLTANNAALDEGEIPYSAMNIRLFYTEQLAVNAFHRVLNRALCHLIRKDGSCLSLPTPGNAPAPLVIDATTI
jgi:sulfur carrier protein ThiS